MSIIAWEVSRWHSTPERKEYVRETANFYVRENGSRDAKVTSYSKLYADYDEACAAIKARLDSEETKKKAELVRKAAPDLLEALDNLLSVYAKPDELICCNGHECGCMGASVYQEAEHYARAAIAKARGEK